MIAGCGPAGAVLGLLLARAGLTVTVVERHGDLLRDFRGDTIHASTLTLLDELGLGAGFARRQQQRVTEVRVAVGDREWSLADVDIGLEVARPAAQRTSICQKVRVRPRRRGKAIR